MSDTSNPAQSPRPTLTRRSLLKTTAGAGATAIGAGAGGVVPDEFQLASDADALACGGICLGAAAVGGAAVVGWALREYEVVGADDPPQGLTADALKQDVYTTLRTRKSTNASTIIDNENILDGAKNVAYSDGKLAAIKKLNNDATQQAVQDAATAAVDDYESTLKKNLLKTWNESVNELTNVTSALESHSETSAGNFVAEHGPNEDSWSNNYPQEASSPKSVSLPNGSTFDVKRIANSSSGNERKYDPTGYINSTDPRHIKFRKSTNTALGDAKVYLHYSDWNAIYTKIGSICDTVRNGLITWVGEVYSKVQSGELDTSELLTPTELAQLTSSEESNLNQALADLMALNIPVNLDREAEIRIPSSGTTLYGSLGVTGQTTLNAGTTIDPSADSHDYYLTYDVSEAHGTWSAYQEGVDGGIVTFTQEPHPGVVYGIETGAQETAEVPAGDFTSDGSGNWTVDISGQVETAITTVTSVQFYSNQDKTKMETVLLDETFEIVTFRNSEDEQVDSATYDKPAQPESDSNYITEEEWKQREQEYKDLIDKYEEQTNGGGTTGPILGDFAPSSMIGGAVVLIGTILGIGQLTK